MDIEIWHVWIIIAVILFIVEIFTPSFIFGSIAVGCILAGVSSAFGFGIKVQLIAFAIGTLVAFFGIRSFMLKYFHKKSNKIKTNTDALIGKIGRVTETINTAQNVGRIMVEGDDWKAETENDEIINAGEKVEIVAVNSTILTVKSIR
ncbi:MAG: NfeD family protein [Candidatus Kapabacteria bacterium]|jgi:membrane protein implicated in regulation of membrane protease activity|nr:NfeD family protein [Candidatus Kapabacteria bacterium]